MFCLFLGVCVSSVLFLLIRELWNIWVIPLSFMFFSSKIWRICYEITLMKDNRAVKIAVCTSPNISLSDVAVFSLRSTYTYSWLHYLLNVKLCWNVFCSNVENHIMNFREKKEHYRDRTLVPVGVKSFVIKHLIIVNYRVIVNAGKKWRKKPI